VQRFRSWLLASFCVLACASALGLVLGLEVEPGAFRVHYWRARNALLGPRQAQYALLGVQVNASDVLIFRLHRAPWGL